MSSHAEEGSEGNAQGFADVLWQATEKLHRATETSEHEDLIFKLIFLKYVSDTVSKDCETLRDQRTNDESSGERAAAHPKSSGQHAAAGISWLPPEARWDYLQERARHPEIGTLIDNAIDLISVQNPALKEVLPETRSGSHLEASLFGDLIDLISGMSPAAAIRSENDLYESVTGHLLQSLSSEKGDTGALYTPPSVVRALIKMIGPYSCRVYDSCSGSGGMFTQSEPLGAPGRTTACGQEAGGTAWRLAEMNTVLHSLELDLGARSGCGLQRDMHRSLQADYVIGNIPFNLSGWGRDQLLNDPRWEYGIPPDDNANFAFLQDIVSVLSPRGSAAVIMPNSAASSRRRSEAEIRRRMIEADLIQCIIALPEQLFDTTQIGAAIWVLKRDKTPDGDRPAPDRRGETLFIDARSLGVMVDRSHRKLTADDQARITGTYHAWLGASGAGSYVDLPGFSRSATIREIAQRRYVLTPSQYVSDAGSGRLDERIIRLTEGWRAAGWQVGRLADFVMHSEYLHSEKAPERPAKIAKFRGEDRLVLPIEAHFNAVYGTVPEVLIRNRCLLVALTPGINGMSLAAWLNSEDGRQARRAAMPGTDRSPRTVSLANLRRFLNELVVPVRPGH